MNHPNIYPLGKSYDDISSHLFISCPNTVQVITTTLENLNMIGSWSYLILEEIFKTQLHNIMEDLLKRFPMHSNQQYLVGLEQQHILFTRNIHDSLRITTTSMLQASHMMIFLHTYLSIVPTQYMSSPPRLQN